MTDLAQQIKALAERVPKAGPMERAGYPATAELIAMIPQIITALSETREKLERMMVETVSLKACRKCGSDKADTDKRREYWFAECLHCGYHTETMDTEDEAITAWNTRASEAHTLRVAEAVREACAEAMDQRIQLYEDKAAMRDPIAADCMNSREGSILCAEASEYGAAAIRALDIGRIVEGWGDEL